MAEDLPAMICRWDRDSSTDIEFPRLLEIIQYLDQRLFSEYTPTQGPHITFQQRLSAWLSDAPNDKSRQTMFQLVSHLFFIGREAYISLYREAYRSPITRWIIDSADIDLCDPVINTKIAQAMNETWFCPISDSMQISEFYHANRISGVHFRPVWLSLAKFGDRAKLTSYTQKKFKRVVLLEDFVAAGGQMQPALNLAAELPKDIEFLLVPLVICPKGADSIEDFVKRNPANFTFSPVLRLPPRAFVAETPVDGESPFFEAVRQLVQDIYLQVSGGKPPDDNTKPYGPFGWKRTGALVVMYTNTPDNTLPIIHWTSNTWRSPLFPRSSRE